MEDERYARFKLKEYTHWSVYLFENQCRLGRCYIWAKRTDDVDIVEMSAEERDEFFLICGKLKAALNQLFQPTRLNYAALSNEAHHLHVHVIPRYDVDKELGGVTFKDTNKRGAPWPYDKSFTIPEELLLKIRDDIAKLLA